MGKNILFCGFGELGTKCAGKSIKADYAIVFVVTHRNSLGAHITNL